MTQDELATETATTEARTPEAILKWLSGVLHVPFSLETPAAAPSDPGSRTSFFLLNLPGGRGYLLPDLGSRTAEGLNLANPQGWRGRAARASLERLLRLRIAQRRLPIVRLGEPEPDSSLLRSLERVMGVGQLCFAISLGTPGPIREPVLQLMRENGEIVGYAKVDWTGRGVIRREGELLRTLHALQKTSFLFPSVLFADAIGDRYVVVTAAPERPARFVTERMVPDVMSALEGLSRWNREVIVFEKSASWAERQAEIDRLDCREVGLIRGAAEEVLRRLGGRQVVFHFSHGDFVPVNMKRVGRKLLLLDWEAADRSRPTGYDVFHYVTVKASHGGGMGPDAVYRELKTKMRHGIIADYFHLQGVPEDQWHALLQCYLLRRLVFNAAPGMCSAFQLGRMARLLELSIEPDGH